MLDSIDIWRQAINQSTEACCFVSNDDYFLYCNDAWCKLVGYSEYELKEKKWQEITLTNDIGADKGQLEAIKNSAQDDSYYVEKVYVRKDKTKINVGIYVHTYPKNSTPEGLIVFCKPLSGSAEYESLKEKFYSLQKSVIVLEKIAVSENETKKIMEAQTEISKENRKLIMAMMSKADVNTTNNVGNKSGDSFDGNFRDVKNTNDSKVIRSLIIGFGFLCSALISLGLVLAYLAYYNTNNPDMDKPEIKQLQIDTE